MTDTVIVVVCDKLPEIPFSINGYVPTVTVAWVVTVSTVLAVGVTGFLANSAVIPDGRPVTLRFTPELKPPVEVSCVVKVIDCPWTTD